MRSDTPRSLARRARQRRRAIGYALALSVLAVIATVVVARSEIVRGSSGGAAAPLSSAEPSSSGPVPDGDIAAPATAPVAAEPASNVIEIGWVGDTTPGSRYGAPPDGGRALFARVRDHTTAPDIMVANLEGTFGTGGRSKCDSREASDCYAFQAPPANAAALAWAGIDVVNLANNHSNDYLAAGQRATRSALGSNKIAYTGLSGTMAVREVDGTKVAFLGFAPYPWTSNIGDLDKARALVRKADKSADVVVVLMHAGAEGSDRTRTPRGPERDYGEFRGDSRAFSHAVIDAGADVVLGSGPHVVRGLERYRGRLIAYSLGNFAGWSTFGRSGTLGLSGLLEVRIAPDGRVLGGRWVSLRIAGPGVPEPDPKKSSLSLVRRLSEQDFETPVTLAPDGTFSLAPE